LGLTLASIDKKRGLDNLGVDNLFINQVLLFSAATRLTFSSLFIAGPGNPGENKVFDGIQYRN
jgi:hypothetical protein